AKGREITHNSGYFSLDPLIDWTPPQDGRYVVMIRDMLYRGTPSSVYRLRIGPLPYNTWIFPAGGRRGTTTAVTVNGANLTETKTQIPIAADSWLGVREIGSAFGTFRFMVGEYPEVTHPPTSGPMPVRLPATFNGHIEGSDQADDYKFTLGKNAGRVCFEL